jgi:hypothetical protein
MMDVVVNKEKRTFAVGDMFEITGNFYLLCEETFFVTSENGYKYRLKNMNGKSYYDSFASLEDVKIDGEYVHYPKGSFILSLEPKGADSNEQST